MNKFYLDTDALEESDKERLEGALEGIAAGDTDFVLELSGGRPALVSDRETLELTRACLLAREAADTGTKILF